MNQRELKRILSFTGFGFASGLPYVLVFITLTAWLRSEGLDLSVIGFFGWITLTYSLKFLWAPFVDRFSIPVLSSIGSRRSWILLMQIIILISLIFISLIDPTNNLYALFMSNSIEPDFSILKNFQLATYNFIK